MNKQKALENLKTFREAAPPVSETVRESLKKQNRFVKIIKEALADSPKTVPRIAEMSGLPAHEIFWYMNALRKYGFAEIGGEDGSYLLYKTVRDENEECAINESR